MEVPCSQTAPHKRAEPALWTALALLFACAVAATFYYCQTMSGGMPMPGGWTMSMTWMRMPGQSWAGAAVMFMSMWTAMMVAMMLPSALPMILGFFRARGRLGSTLIMTAGYFFAWIVAGAVIFVLGVLFGVEAMRWEKLSRAVPWMMGAGVMLGGIMQFMPWTMHGLRRCRASACQGSDGRSPWRVGVESGACCVACCSGPTLILVALGMMNLVVIVTVAVAIALEKLLPKPRQTVYISGVAALLIGMVIVGRTIFAGHMFL